MLGGPGSGKTMLLRELSCRTARAALEVAGALEAASPTVRAEACDIVGERIPVALDVFQRVQRCLEDPSPRVRRAALTAILAREGALEDSV